MYKKLLWIVIACLFAGMVISMVCYSITRSTYAGIIMAIFIVLLIFIMFFSSFFDSLKKKKWISVISTIMFLIVACVLMLFIAHNVVLLQDKQKEIDEISALIEQQEDDDEKYRLLIDEKWPLIDKRFELNQRLSLLTMGINATILSIYLIGLVENKLKEHKTNKDRIDK